jgi:polyferredoxin/tetratricopeptide (TPR) repeat protein
MPSHAFEAPGMSCEPRTPGGRSALSLPVIAAGPDGHVAKGPKAPHSRMGWRRAAVLATIQILMIVHVVQWLWTGETIAPIEPSEAMETSKYGVINPGTIFFLLALTSTALLGRWFCGWGCHVVMLQDFCGYLMKKVGIRPKLFRSRLLLWLPLALAVYMFLWPVIYRIAIAPFTRPELSWPGFSTQFTTTDFWATFPGLLMAVPFLFVCGFLTVYLLGAKGYCNYGCPYGGFFAPLDELSPVRIRVTDACTQCGHCTAVCTSNVRVHEEVRDFKMVVDQGCMKCLDCVSACPEQALHVGFGKPAFLAKPREGAAPTPRKYDLSWNEELALAAVAILSFFALRGAVGVPLLFASGVAACVTYLAWLCAELVRRRDVRLHRFQLKRDGRIRGAGAVVASISGASFTALAYVGALNVVIALGDFWMSRVQVPPAVVYSGMGMRPPVDVVRDAERARGFYRLALPSPDGYAIELFGFDDLWRPVLEGRVAWLDAVAGDYKASEARLRAMAERLGMTEAYAAGIARAMRGGGDLPGSIVFAREQWSANLDWETLREQVVDWLVADERREDALALAREAVARRPDDLNAMRRLSILLVEAGDRARVEEGIAMVTKTLEIAPGNPFAHKVRAEGLNALGRVDEAEADLRRAMELAPDDWRFMQALGEFLMSHDKQREAMPLIRRATEMRAAERR